MKIVIGIPAFNEEENIARILIKLKKISQYIIVCDDGSTDDTEKNARNHGAIVIKHEKGNIVYLKDVATVTFDYKDKANYARLYEKQVVMVDVVKRSGENLLNATKKI